MSLVVRARPAPEPMAAPEARRRSLMPSRVLVPIAILALAAGFRLWNLASPDMTIADEAYYAADAENYLGGGVSYTPAPFETIPEESTWMHPPLGKELIALGVGPLGVRAIGWRLPSAVAGVVGVLLVYLLALALWRSVAWAGLASLFIAVDGLHVVMSRLAMLDIFLAMFVTAGFLFVVRELSPGRRAGPAWTTRFGGRELVLAGMMFGCAVATKWSGAFALAAAVAILVVNRRPSRAIVLSLVVVPAAVYLLAYFPFWLAHGPDVIDFVRLQGHMLARQLGTTSANPLASSPLSWPPMLEPLVAYPTTTAPIPRGAVRIVAVGNPVLWWGFLAGLGPLIWAAVRQADRGARIAMASYLSLWAPWLVFGRTEYFFYMTPAVPFMAIGLVAAIRTLPSMRRGIAVALASLAGAGAIAFAPVWLGIDVSARWYDAIRLLPSWR
jgi:dolichyl-phosphate-mannose--protein O-mannosyl transferase